MGVDPEEGVVGVEFRPVVSGLECGQEGCPAVVDLPADVGDLLNVSPRPYSRLVVLIDERGYLTCEVPRNSVHEILQTRRWRLLDTLLVIISAGRCGCP